MTRTRNVLALAATSAMALSLAACDRNANTGAAPVADASALPPLSASAELPPAKPAPVARAAPQRAYAYAERAYGMQQSVYDAPPDYGFSYDGEEPLVWRTADDWSMYAEPADDGYRYYYYEPGAAYPYFVRDRDYGYGYDRGGALIAVFDSGGRYLPDDVLVRVSPVAGRYFVRGRDLWQAGRRAPRIEVDETVWTRAAPRVNRDADPWLRAARADADWQAWRDRDGNRELQRFRAEQQRREALARQRLADDRGRPADPRLAAELDHDRRAEDARRIADPLRADQDRALRDRAELADRQRQAQDADRARAAQQRLDQQARAQHAQDEARAKAARDAQLQARRQDDAQRQRQMADAQRAREAAARAGEQQRAQHAQAEAAGKQAHLAQMQARQQAEAQRRDGEARQQQARAAEQQQRAQRDAQAQQARAADQAQRAAHAREQAQQAQAHAAEQQAREAASRERAAQAQAQPHGPGGGDHARGPQGHEDKGAGDKARGDKGGRPDDKGPK